MSLEHLVEISAQQEQLTFLSPEIAKLLHLESIQVLFSSNLLVGVEEVLRPFIVVRQVVTFLLHLNSVANLVESVAQAEQFCLSRVWSLRRQEITQ